MPLQALRAAGRALGVASSCRAASPATGPSSSTRSARAARSSGSAPGSTASPLYFREDAAALGQVAGAPRPGGRGARPAARGARRGALFWDDLLEETGLDADEALPALWDLVWAGEVTNDAWTPLRAGRRHGVPKPERRPRRFSRARGDRADRDAGPLVADRAALRRRARAARARRAAARAAGHRHARRRPRRGHPGRLRRGLRRAARARDARPLPPRLLRRGARRRAVRARRRGRAAPRAARGRGGAGAARARRGRSRPSRTARRCRGRSGPARARPASPARTSCCSAARRCCTSSAAAARSCRCATPTRRGSGRRSTRSSPRPGRRREAARGRALRRRAGHRERRDAAARRGRLPRRAAARRAAAVSAPSTAALTLLDIQEASYRDAADGALRGSWPPEQAMDRRRARGVPRRAALLRARDHHRHGPPAGAAGRVHRASATRSGSRRSPAAGSGTSSGRRGSRSSSPRARATSTARSPPTARSTIFDAAAATACSSSGRRGSARGADWAVGVVRAARRSGSSPTSAGARGRHAPPRRGAAPAARRPAARGRGAAPARAGRARRRAARRPAARVGRGDRQEPRPPLRGRRRAPLAPADERPLDGAAARQPRSAAGRGSSSAAQTLEGVLWGGPCSSSTPARSPASGRTSSPRRPTSTRCSPGCARADGTRTLGETLLDQSLVAGIGNMWMAETLWAGAALAVAPARRGRRARPPPRARDRRGADARRRRRRPRAAQAGLPAGRPAVPALRHADPLARPGRRQPHRVLVPGLPARRATGSANECAVDHSGPGLSGHRRRGSSSFRAAATSFRASTASQRRASHAATSVNGTASPSVPRCVELLHRVENVTAGVVAPATFAPGHRLLAVARE